MVNEAISALLMSLLVIVWFFGSSALIIVSIWATDAHWFVKLLLSLHVVILMNCTYRLGALVNQRKG